MAVSYLFLRSFTACTLHVMLDYVNKNAMGGAYGMNGGDEK
jgi:hypothetical protein